MGTSTKWARGAVSTESQKVAEGPTGIEIDSERQFGERCVSHRVWNAPGEWDSQPRFERYFAC